MALPHYAFFQGRIVPYSEARVGVLTHALNYGTGVFSGIRGYWNPDEKELFVFRPEDHYRRFLDSGRMLGMTLPLDAGQLAAAVTDLLRKEGFREDCYVRSLAFYADETVGVRLHDLTPEISIVSITQNGSRRRRADRGCDSLRAVNVPRRAGESTCESAQ